MKERGYASANQERFRVSHKLRTRIWLRIDAQTLKEKNLTEKRSVESASTLLRSTSKKSKSITKYVIEVLD